MSKSLQRIVALSLAFSMSGVGVALATEAAMTDNEVPIDQGTYLGTPWASGGVGDSAREALMKEYDDYNLKLEFAVADGNYLTDVAVSITTPDGVPVLRAFSPGPWLMTKLPAGRYDVAVNGFEKTFVREVTVPAQGMETLIFNDWTKAGVAEATPGPSY
ncbi:hypothetical protein [Halochromatium salexigens]|uniref:Carboxypeptidase regulatory-like domain-containing protein n=1 Tax=Halochromatium salexigens TaxID=49447 RepID=A0AAJ0XFX7_HALSE|nr:hypothetical protein [Halochromatium salexigens]MBK5930165.1 hypothetical protein [Halochromatium salexigens]